MTVLDGWENFYVIVGSSAGASHVLPLERPEDFNKVVLSFLKT